MKIFDKQNTEWSFNPRIFIIVWVIGGLLSMAAYSETPLRNEQFDQAQSLLMVSNNFAREALLESKLQKHTVQSGETLYRISANYFVSVQTLQNINLISNPASLQAGSVIYIPPVDESAAFLKKYQVKVGDSIDSLTSQYNLAWWQFQQLNPKLKEPLGVGTVVVLPLNASVNRETKLPLIRPVRGFLTSRFGFRWDECIMA
jgi:LysM repeat protein